MPTVLLGFQVKSLTQQRDALQQECTLLDISRLELCRRPPNFKSAWLEACYVWSQGKAVCGGVDPALAQRFELALQAIGKLQAWIAEGSLSFLRSGRT